MLSRKSKKDAPLPQRPEPPSVEQIIEDIHNSDKSDIIFRLQKEGEKDKGLCKLPILSSTLTQSNQ